jgi:hypothetical protein
MLETLVSIVPGPLYHLSACCPQLSPDTLGKITLFFDRTFIHTISWRKRDMKREQDKDNPFN